MLFRDNLIPTLGFGELPCLSLELFSEGLVVEKSPGVVELVVPCPLELDYAPDDLVQLGITDQGEKCGINAIGADIFRRIVVAFYSVEWFGGLKSR